VQLAVELDLEPCPSLPPLVHIAFYRVAQEALHNVVKHSGAKQVSMRLSVSPPVSLVGSEEWEGQVTLSVSDDGQGFDQGVMGPDHLGLGFMRERAAAMGGSLTIQSERGQGTQVMLVWGTLPR
jgi:signal transduction histidine kinase